MIFIGLGSNEGNPAKNLRQALDLLPKHEIKLIRCSAFYRTEPWGITEQNVFVNAVAELAYEGEAIELLDALLAIEQEMGRIRHFKWGPRLIDLDVLEFHRQEIDTERLQLPHPYYPERDFVLVPMAELEPDWVPTGLEMSLSEKIAELEIPDMPIWEED
ncbi:MAG: 2-amino-4-hydroxy-6-hydroxymethyldihydropteridine diphosphokinase [Bacteroidota bacterium]